MSEVKENLKDMRIWLRGLFMLLFAIFFIVARLVLVAVVIIQFLIRLFSGHLNDRLLDFGSSLSTYMYEIMLYLTFNQEQKPFPFADWPAPTTRIADEFEVVEEVDEHEQMSQAAEPSQTPPEPVAEQHGEGMEEAAEVVEPEHEPESKPKS